jgi:hypothetical protein
MLLDGVFGLFGGIREGKMFRIELEHNEHRE